MNWRRAAIGAAVLVLAACGGGGGSAQTASGPAPSPATQPAGAPPNSGPTTDPRLSVATGFVANTIAAVPGARELAALPNGDLLAGTTGSQLWLVPNAENAGAAGTAHAFIDLHQGTVNGVAISPDGQTIYAATQTTIFRVSYHAGDQTEPDASAQAIAHVRTGSIAPHS
ncbi:MAG: hypothetical protein ACREM8_14475, partial [Vulcanimicrobiaceae bacterium]